MDFLLNVEQEMDCSFQIPFFLNYTETGQDY